MAANYRYCLGIDLGIASLGTALVRCDENGTPRGILDAGVRLFAVPEGASARRMARQTRKTIRRRRQRLHDVLRCLQVHDFLPQDAEALKALMRRSPYRLRARAARHALNSPAEVGRCLLHLARFRGAGFLGQIEECADGAEESSQRDKQKSANLYRYLESKLKHSGQTVGEFLATRLREAEQTKGRIRRRKNFLEDGSVNFAIPRFLIKAEFTKIWETQAKFFPQMTEELKDELYEIIFRDRPHAPYAVGKCSLAPESGELRIPRMSRLADTRRIYEQVNNLRIRTDTAVLPLSRAMRDAVVAACMQGQTLKKKDLKRILAPLHDERIVAINLGDEESSIKGFCLVSAFAAIPTWKDMSEEEQDAVLAFMAEPRIYPDDPRSPLMSEEEFLSACVRRLHLEDVEGAEEIVSRCLHDLPDDRSMLGVSATKNILAKLIEGKTEVVDGKECWYPLSNREAADACGYLAEEERARSRAGTYDALPYYGEILTHDVTPIHPWHEAAAAKEEVAYGRVPNPVVHVALNQLRKVVNEIIDLYGKPMRIHVELAREFGMSAANRDKLKKEQQNRRKENAEIDEELKKINIRPSRWNRIKYRLWKEQGCRDIYTLKPIEITELERCDIDHIIPQALGGSDSYANLALTRSTVNRAKSNSSAYDFIQQHSPNAWIHILELISDKRKYPPSKAWRFLENAKDRFLLGDEEQTDHRLHDTSYMSKMALRYLSSICRDVVPLRGGMTADLRHLWGLDGLEYQLMDIPINSYLYDEETGEILYDQWNRPLRNPEWKAKPRIDQRHHAEDAIILACTSRSMMQRLAHAANRGDRKPAMPIPFGQDAAAFRQTVLRSLQQIKPSPKAEHGLEDQLHEQTRYRVLAEIPQEEGQYLCTYRKQLSAVRKLDNIKISFGRYAAIPGVDDIAAKNQNIRDSIVSRYEEARQNLVLRQASNLRARNIDERLIIQESLNLARKQDSQVGFSYQDVLCLSLVNVKRSTQSGYKPGGNLCVDFYEKQDGKVGWECSTVFDANQKNFQTSWERAGHKLLWRVFKDDVMELQFSDVEKQALGIPQNSGGNWFRVQKFSKGTLQVKLLQDARELQARDGEIACWVSGENGLSYFTKAQARKVELSPFGKVIHKHKKLWYGKKTKKS